MEETRPRRPTKYERGLVEILAAVGVGSPLAFDFRTGRLGHVQQHGELQSLQSTTTVFPLATGVHRRLVRTVEP